MGISPEPIKNVVDPKPFQVVVDQLYSTEVDDNGVFITAEGRPNTALPITPELNPIVLPTFSFIDLSNPANEDLLLTCAYRHAGQEQFGVKTVITQVGDERYAKTIITNSEGKQVSSLSSLDGNVVLIGRDGRFCHIETSAKGASRMHIGMRLAKDSQGRTLLVMVNPSTHGTSVTSLKKPSLRV